MALIDSAKVQLRAGDDTDRVKWFRMDYKPLREQKERLENGLILKRQYKISLFGEQKTLSAVVEHRILSTDAAYSDDFIREQWPCLRSRKNDSVYDKTAAW